VDDRGFGVSHGTVDATGTAVLAFDVDAEFHYVDPNVTAPEYDGRKYFLEVLAPAGTSGATLSGAIRVAAEDLSTP
jgi:hypothetical protein